MKNGRKICVHGHGAIVAVSGLVLTLMMPLLPVVVGAIELSFLDTHIAFEWLRSTGVEETIADFYRELGWVF